MGPPSPLRLLGPKAEPPPAEPVMERYVWTRRLHEWVSASPVWFGATPAQEVAYLEQWRAHALADECADGERLVQIEREEGEECRPRGQAVQLAVQPTQQEDLARAWEAAFP